VQAAASRLADPQSKESYQVHSFRLLLNGNRPEGLVRQGEEEANEYDEMKEDELR
jgi:hypothetical protein